MKPFDRGTGAVNTLRSADTVSSVESRPPWVGESLDTYIVNNTQTAKQTNSYVIICCTGAGTTQRILRP